MSVATLFLGLLVIVGVVFGLVFLISFFAPDARDNRAVRRQQTAEAAAVRAREKIATKALRSIANGAGNPIFEAQDALDLIEGTYTNKELN